MRRSFKRHVGLNGVYNGDSEFMAGESIMFSGPADKIPAGYLIEDGAAVGRVAYATLFAAIGTTYGAGDGATTFNLPDSRGEFWRGLDLGRGVDTGRYAGSAQLDAFQGHGHQVVGGDGAGHAAGSQAHPSVTGEVARSWVAKKAIDIGFGVPRVANETRGRNIAKIPLIKY